MLLSVLRIISWHVVSIHKSKTIHAVLRMLLSFVSPHYQVFLCLLKSDGANKLVAICRHVDISHVLLLVSLFASTNTRNSALVGVFSRSGQHAIRHWVVHINPLLHFAPLLRHWRFLTCQAVVMTCGIQ